MDKVTYTTEEFARLGRAIEALSRPFRSVTVPNGDVEIVLIAIRIAQRAMTPGFLEGFLYEEWGPDRVKFVDTIRAALLKGSDHDR